MAKAVFINLLHAEEKEAGLTAAIGALSDGEQSPTVHAIDPTAFGAIPGAPFAYWASERLRSLFSTVSAFDGDGRTVRQGLATADDFRFVRAWWEVPAGTTVSGTAHTTPEAFRAQTFAGKRWVPLAKGGAYATYYSDLHLVINWERDGEEVTDFPGSVIRNSGYYFRPGLTYTNSTTSAFSIRCLAAGAIFSHMGQSCFIDGDDATALMALLSLMNSKPYAYLLDLQVGLADKGRRHYEVGLIRQTPVPMAAPTADVLAMVERSVHVQMDRHDAAETSHRFLAPKALSGGYSSLNEAFRALSKTDRAAEQALAALQKALDGHAMTAYGMTEGDLTHHADVLEEPHLASEADDEAGNNTELSTQELAFSVLSYSVGALFGRWDVRAVRDDQQALPYDPFAPLPPHACGMLNGPASASGTPEADAKTCPLPIQSDGIMPMDEGHPANAIANVRTALAHFFADPAAVERELCSYLKCRTLEQFLDGKFFGEHIRRYSMSRRKAPIYWQLCSPAKHYGLWLYYPSLTRDTLYVALRVYVGPKLAHEEELLQALKAQLAEAKLAGTRDEQLVRQAEAQEAIVQDVAAFRDELEAIADAGYDPDLNDGVLINIAPLHRLVPWKEAAACYKELKAGKYPWSSLHQRYTFR